MPEPHYFRDFLNTPGHHAGAYVLASVEFDDSEASALGPRLDAQLTLGDCGRVVRLDFSCYDVDDLDNALYKARLLRRAVDEFAAALEEHADGCRQVLAETDDGVTGPGAA